MICQELVTGQRTTVPRRRGGDNGLESEERARARRGAACLTEMAVGTRVRREGDNGMSSIQG